MNKRSEAQRDIDVLTFSNEYTVRTNFRFEFTKSDRQFGTSMNVFIALTAGEAQDVLELLYKKRVNTIEGINKELSNLCT
jgi:N-methylhydantoinase B/oxoprolinase/acetone carboxylase alpha subunit